MGRIYKNGIDYTGGNANIVELTQSQYDALPDSKYTDGVVYAIKDYNTPSVTRPIVNYSTEEQVIGTWIDGKPLYQKTVQWVNNDGFVMSELLTFDHNISDIKEICDYFINAYRGGGSICMKLPLMSANSGNNITCERVTTTNIQVRIGSNYVADYVIKISMTIQYTKTTD